MRKTPPNNTPRSTETRFSPPAFPPKAGKANHIVRVSKKGQFGVGQRDVRYCKGYFVDLRLLWGLWD